MPEVLSIVVEVDNSGAVRAFKQTAAEEQKLGKQADVTAAQMGLSWKQFVAQRMSETMKLTGSHGAAMKLLGQQWREMQQSATQETQKLGPALQKVGSQGNVVFTELRDRQQRARDATNLLARTIGAEIPRSLEKVIAKSTTLGPILAGAFNVAVVVGFATALLALVQKIPELTDKIMDWSGGLRKNLELQKDLNGYLLTQAERVADLNKQYRLVGLEGVAVFSEKQKMAEEAVAKAQSAFDEAARSLKKLQEISTQQVPGRGAFVAPTPEAREALKLIPEAQANMVKLNAALVVAKIEARLAGKEFSTALGKDAVAASKDATAQLVADNETLNKMFEEDVARRMKIVDVENNERVASHKLALDEITRLENALAQRQQEADAFLLDVRNQSTAAMLDDIGRIRQAESERFARLEELYRQGVVSESEYAAAKLQITQTAALGIEEIERRRVEETRQLQQRQLHEWQAAVQQMSHAIQSFMDNPIGYLKNLWKRFLAEMVASWILSMRSMSGGPAGAGQGGGFSLGGLLGGLLGIRGGGGGGFGVGNAGIAGGGNIFGIGGVQPTFGNNFSGAGGGSGFQFGQFTPGVAGLSGLAGLPLSAGGMGGFGGAPLPAGAAAIGAGGRMGMGAGLAGLLPGLILGGGMAGIGALGFGSPLRGGIAGALGGALAFGGTAFAAGSLGMFGLMAALMNPVTLPLFIIGGALIGLLFGKRAQNKKKAQAMDILNAGRREWDRVIADYKSFRIPYESAIGGITQVWQQMVQQWSNPGLGKYGGIAIRNNTPEYQSKLREIEQIESERQRRMQIQGGPAQFHSGGFVSPSFAAPFVGERASVSPIGFRPRASGPMQFFHSGGEVNARLLPGEFVVRRQAVQRAGRAAMERLNATGEMSGAGGGIIVNIYPQSLDRAWLRNGGAEEIGREIRRARREGAYV